MISTQMDFGGKYLSSGRYDGLRTFCAQPHIAAGLIGLAYNVAAQALCGHAPAILAAKALVLTLGAAFCVFVADAQKNSMFQKLDTLNNKRNVIETRPSREAENNIAWRMVAQEIAQGEKWKTKEKIYVYGGVALVLAVLDGGAAAPQFLAITASNWADSFFHWRRFRKIEENRWVVTEPKPLKKPVKSRVYAQQAAKG